MIIVMNVIVALIKLQTFIYHQFNRNDKGRYNNYNNCAADDIDNNDERMITMKWAPRKYCVGIVLLIHLLFLLLLLLPLAPQRLQEREM